MTEADHETEPPQPPPDQGVCISWHRVATYLGSIAVILAMWICALIYTVREHPDRFMAHIFEQLPQPATFGKVAWVNRRTLEMDDIKIGGFFYADSIIITANPFGLIRRHVTKVQVIGGQVFTAPLYDFMDSPT